MATLPEQLEECMRGRVCLMGLGNVDYGDDGFGVRLAERLVAEGLPNITIAGTMPERYIGRPTEEPYDYLIFLDAAEFGAAPGSVVFLNAEEMAARFPQISTHKISLGLLAKWIEDSGKTKARLLGVQPESLKNSDELSPAAQKSLELLSSILSDLWKSGKDSNAGPFHQERLVGRPVAESSITEVNV